ncbi:MAG: branched-chain amino acid aminotransferase [Bacteroidota bacterium]
MKYNIKVTKSKESGLSSVDFDNIPFGRVFSDHMFTADYIDGEWTNFEIVPFGPFSIHPACLALHYGQAVFEGMKASKTADGQALLMRPEMHARRINNSASRLCMPDFPEDLFVEALHQLIGLDEAWIPPQTGSALYIRPFMFANGEFIGVAPSDTYKMMIFTGPVGPYYPKPVRLIAEEEYVRAVKGGVGEAKAAGNYGASLLPAKKAREAGYDQILWLDGNEFKYIQEVGTMNIFFVIDGTVVTPATDGAILKGITRDSFFHILRDKGYRLEERPITIDEVVQAHNAGKLTEVFGAGTAAVVAKVSDLTYRDQEMVLPPLDENSVGTILKREIDGLRAGTIVDTRNWMVPVSKMVTA